MRLVIANGRETVELVDGRRYWSDDHWQTARYVNTAGQVRTLKKGPLLDRIRYIALVQHGGGRDEQRPSKKRPVAI